MSDGARPEEEQPSLRIDEIPLLLLSAEVAPIESFFDGSFSVFEMTRRNRNHRAVWNGGGVILKQPEASDSSSALTLQHEAAFYAAFEGAADLPIPKRVAVAGMPVALLLELVPNSVTLRELGGSQSTSATVYEALGRAVARVHEFGSSAVCRATAFAQALPPPAAPWALSIHKPGPEILLTLSAANTETLQIIQDDAAIAGGLEQLRSALDPATLIHGDLRADNILVREADSPDPQIVIVDWELVQRGDPAWDVGAVFQELLEQWVRTRLSEEAGDAQDAARGETSLATMQSRCRAFWLAYASAAALSGDRREAFLARVVRCSAAQLVQRAFEYGLSLDRLSRRPIALLQVASNLFASPDAGISGLYGLPPRAGVNDIDANTGA